MKFCTLIACAMLLSLTYGAPQMRRHRRHWNVDDAFAPDKMPWKDSCVIRNDTMIDLVNTCGSRTNNNRTARPLKGLRNEIPLFVSRLKRDTVAIDTDDVWQWFDFNSTYQFLAQINTSISNIHLRKRHIETQVYVGAFQYLGWKQSNYDRMRNDNNSKTKALEKLLTLAKNLLCEIETAIKNACMKTPMILTRESMQNRLTFRNNNRDRMTSTDVDDIDTKFAKIRFSEYLHGMEQVLKNRVGKQHQNAAPKKQRKNMLQKKRVGGKRIPSAFAAAKPHRPIQHNNNINNNNINRVRNHLSHNNHANVGGNSSGGLWSRRRPLHRNNGPAHRSRHLAGKSHRTRKQFPIDVAGLGPNDIKSFRRNHRKSALSTTNFQLRALKTSTTTKPTQTTTSTTTTTTTTVTPQS